MEKNARIQLSFGAAVLLLSLLALSSATYAWFTFSADTNVEPLQGNIGYGDGNLLISNLPDGEFAEYCELPAIGENVLLQPLSTADLHEFYVAKEQNRDGIVTKFARTDDITTTAVMGTVYLKCESGNTAIYFNREALNFGEDGQALAALRLGLMISSEWGSKQYIFKLDDMGNTGNAQAQQTITQPGMVVSRLENGEAELVPDPAEPISNYCARATDDPEESVPGERYLCMMSANEIARVDYWLYLEGCDENCINAVQGRDLALSLGFTGINAD